MSSLTQKMSTMSSFKARTPASKEQISNAEKELGLSFSEEYVEYLSKFGCASIYGHEFTGISSNPRLDVVNVTKSQKTVNDNIPFDWYVIEETNIDSITIWQDYTGAVYATKPNETVKILAESFLYYLCN